MYALGIRGNGASIFLELGAMAFFGGYPGAALFIDQEEVWARYVTDSLIETVLARDVLTQTTSRPVVRISLTSGLETSKSDSLNAWGSILVSNLLLSFIN